jgi:hypothetical protein
VLPPPEGPEPGYIVVFIVLPARCSPCSPSSDHSQRPFGPNSSHPMASVLSKRRHLKQVGQDTPVSSTPTVAPGGLARTHEERRVRRPQSFGVRLLTRVDEDSPQRREVDLDRRAEMAG